MGFSSKLIEEAVDQMSSLPGIGTKTAFRLVMDILNRPSDDVQRFANSFIELKEKIIFCSTCHNISDTIECDICTNEKRDQLLICVVEDTQDVIAIENTGQYKGVYHVLGGKINPMEGIGPNDLKINTLFERSDNKEIREVILALSATIEGDATNFYIYRKLSSAVSKISTLSKGVAIGNDLQYTDELTLGRSIVNRLPFENTLNIK